MKLVVSALTKYLGCLLLVGALLFLPAGTLPYPAVMAARIRNEEQVLERELPGYAAYQQKVKYRLVPFVW